MVAVTSKMLPLGTSAPAFTLDDCDGQSFSLSEAAGAPMVVVFLCNHCPFVRMMADDLAEVARVYGDRGVRFFAINSNDIERYPSDGPDAMRAEAEKRGYTFPYLLDSSQEVAKAYLAQCTPDFYLFDQDHRLVYRGQFDDARPGNGLLVTGSDLRAAMDAVLDGRPVSAEQRPATGCSIKWKAGNEPPYFATHG